MNIVFVSAEISPYASTGGLADVASALPMALKGQGINIIRIMPEYRQVRDRFGDLLRDTQIRLKIPVGMRMKEAEVWVIDSGGAPPTYFIRKDEYFDRRELYSLPERDYDDNFQRFVFFQKAVVALIDTLKFDAQIVHNNDWQTGLVPYFLEHGIQGMGRNRTEKTVFTIHNLAYQGIFPADDFPYTNLPFHVFSLEHLEFYGKVSFLKGGIVGSDRITTVSRTYAKEILTPEFGCGLEGVLVKVQDRLSGIVNGVDYSVWNPASDPLIAANYDASTLQKKDTCKKALLERMGIGKAAKNSMRVPLIGLVSRLVDQKGMALLAESMEQIMALGVNFVLLGSGQKAYQDLCVRWAETWPDRFAVQIGYDNALAHQIEAGADMFMMPSVFEPCGLNQLYSLRYGTVPIVHATGGLEDTIEAISADGRTGTGFKYQPYTVEALVGATKQAVDLYRTQPAAWANLQKRGMAQDYSWDSSAQAYLSLYASILG